MANSVDAESVIKNFTEQMNNLTKTVYEQYFLRGKLIFISKKVQHSYYRFWLH